MQKPFGILIVEDELIIAQDVKEILEEVGYNQVFRAKSFKQAIDTISIQTIDLVLIDINLNDTVSGIDLANYINQHLQIPFIYITSYSDAATIESVKHTKPAGFLLKPYGKTLLLATIEIALFNYANKANVTEQPNEAAVPERIDNELVINQNLLIKENYHFFKVPLEEILWFESDGNYVEVKTIQKKYVIRCSLKRLQQLLPANRFVKCYKTFIINVEFVEKFSKDFVQINGSQIPISRQAQSNVIKLLKS